MSEKFILGIHSSQVSKILNDKKKRSLHDAIKFDTNKFGLNAAQIFVYGPRLPIENKNNYELIMENSKDLFLSVHMCYSSIGIWKVNKKNKDEKISKTKITKFTNELLAVKKTGADIAVLHISKNIPENIAETMSILKPIIESINIKIGLEMVSSKADNNKTYETPEKINNLIELLGFNNNYYCFVIDTAHIHGAGQDITSYNNMNNWLNRLKYKNKIGMFHLNGSYSLKGSGKDKHAIPFIKEDKIWYNIKPEESGLFAVVQFAVKYGVQIICEINIGTEEEAKNGINIIKKLGLSQINV